MVLLRASDTAVTTVRARRMHPEGARLLARRKGLIEPVFGTIKTVLQGRTVHHRGREAVRTEWMLLAAVFNLKTLIRHCPEMIPRGGPAS